MLQLFPCACSAGGRVGGKAAFSLTCGFLGAEADPEELFNRAYTAVLRRQQSLPF